MGQEQRFDFSFNSPDFYNREQTVKNSMGTNGTLFDLQNNMGSHSSILSAGHKQSASNLLSFFTRLGNYDVYYFQPPNKKMAAIIIKISFIIANLFGVSLWIWWLTIDPEGIKIFLSSIGVFLWGTMKLYEKYLDIKEKRRKDITSGNKFRNSNNHKKVS